MNIRDIEHMWKVASDNPNHDTNWHDPVVVKFAALVAELVAAKKQAEIETLYAMYKQACEQRDLLMDQQRAMVAAMRGRIQ